MKQKSREKTPPDEFRWIAFTRDKNVVFTNGELRADRKMTKGERIRVIARNDGYVFDITTAMDWKTTLMTDEFVFVDAPKPVIEAFPKPFEAVLQSTNWQGSHWKVPRYFNGIPISEDLHRSLPAGEKRKPLVRLSLNEGPDKKLFYEVASFGIE